PVYAQAFGETEGRERPRYLRLARHHMLDDLLTIDGEGQSLPHARLADRIAFHRGAPCAVELKHGLHGARNRQHLEPSASGAEDRLGTDRCDRGLPGPHHGNARALLGDLEDVQVLEVGTATPMRMPDDLELDPIARDAANKFPWAAANGVPAELLLADRLEVLPRHYRAFRRNGAAQSRGKS